MATLRPKTSNYFNSKKKDTGLPLYYKDKLPSNSYSSHSMISKLRYYLYKYKKVLTRAFIITVIVYTFLYIYKLIPSSDNQPSSLWEKRKLEVKKVFLESWNDYTRHGWGNDVYSPVSQKGHNMGAQPLGWIIVDSLDTLILMDCEDELEDAKSWVKYELDYGFDYNVNTFETTIRMLGGLLSAYYLTDDEVYLEKAVNLGNKLGGAFNTQSGIPTPQVNLKTGKGFMGGMDRNRASTAEATTLQLEFKYLANLTGEKYFWDDAENVMSVLDANKPESGLVPIYVDVSTGDYKGKLIRLGSRGDSYYEYLLKQYLQTGETIYLEMYLETYNGMKKHLLGKSKPNNLIFLGEKEYGLEGPLSSKMDHLVCFIGGLFALGATEGLTLAEAMKLPNWDDAKQAQLDLGKEIGKTCYHMYHDVEETGLAPEIVVFNTQPDSKKDFYIKPNDVHNLQRPETVETLYYLYKITGDQVYREWGYEIFSNFVKYTKVTSGGKDDRPRYTSLQDVTSNPPKLQDNMESFWLAETLKYLYLLFDDSNDPKWDLKNIVFNTEAHPLPKFDMGENFKTGWKRTLSIETEKSKNVENISEKKKEVKIDFDNDEKIGQVTDQYFKEQSTKDKEALKESFEKEKQAPVVGKERINGHRPEDTDHEGLKIDSIGVDDDSVKMKDNKDVADKIKAKGEIPVAKQPVAKSLNEQASEAKIEALENSLNEESKNDEKELV